MSARKPLLKPMPILWMIAAAFGFAVMGVFVKHARRLPAWEITFFRALINVVLVLPFIAHLPMRQIWRKDWGPLLVRGVSGGLAVVTYFYALGNLKLADAAMLNHSSPIIVLILSSLVLKEKLSRAAVLFILAAFMGVAMILKPDFLITGFVGPEKWAGVAGLLSAVVAAIAYVSVKVATRSVPSTFIVFSFACVLAIMSFVPMILDFVQPTPIEWLMLFGCGLFASAAQAAMTRAYSLLPASVAAPLLLMTVVFSATFGWLFWGEFPDFWSIAGGILVAVGLIGAYRYRNKQCASGL